MGITTVVLIMILKKTYVFQQVGEVKICKSGHACHQKTLGAHRPDTIAGSFPVPVLPQTLGRLSAHHQRLSPISFSNIPNDTP